MKYASKKLAQEILNEQMKDTGYADGNLTMAGMKDMLRYQMRFGEAETNVIIAALIKAGAKFQI
jgi:hypothetical protein